MISDEYDTSQCSFLAFLFSAATSTLIPMTWPSASFLLLRYSSLHASMTSSRWAHSVLRPATGVLLPLVVLSSQTGHLLHLDLSLRRCCLKYCPPSDSHHLIFFGPATATAALLLLTISTFIFWPVAVVLPPPTTSSSVRTPLISGPAVPALLLLTVNSSRRAPSVSEPVAAALHPRTVSSSRHSVSRPATAVLRPPNVSSSMWHTLSPDLQLLHCCLWQFPPNGHHVSQVRPL